MPKTYNISLNLRDVGKHRGNVFVVSHADLPEGNQSTFALGHGALLRLLDFVRVRPAERKRILDELHITGEAIIHDVQVGPTEFVDLLWGNYFKLLHQCSKSAILAATARRAREAKESYASS
jgi:hypothetical protein